MPFTRPVVCGKELDARDGLSEWGPVGDRALLFTSLLGACSQQVNHVQMVTNVGQDLELGHQSFVFTGRGSLCVRSEAESGWWHSRLLSRRGGIPALSVCQGSACGFTDFPTFCRKARPPGCFPYSSSPEPRSFELQ